MQAESVLEGAKHLFALCEKRHFEPFRNRISFFGQYNYTTIIFFAKYFYLIKSAREREEAMYLPRSSSKHSDHGTLPPCPKSCQNMTRTWDTSAKIYQRTAGVSARWFDAMNDKKHRYSLQKHTFCQHALWSAVRGTSSYKIKKKLF